MIILSELPPAVTKIEIPSATTSAAPAEDIVEK
jgi:hypothetical protein